MVGDDEARARLVEMQGRISQGPHSALGLPDSASAEEVHSAFLELTKRFHPARFGRLSHDIQRLANEVFLGIKLAHDALLKVLGVPTRGAPGNLKQSGGFPRVDPADGSGRTPGPQRLNNPPARTTGQVPVVARPTPMPSSFAQGTARSPSPVGRPPTPQPGTQPPTTPGSGIQQLPATPRTLTPTGNVPRIGTPSPVTRPPSGSPPVRTTPPLGVPIQRPSTPSTTRPQTPPAAPQPRRDEIDPGTLRYNGVQPARATGQIVFDERSALEHALNLLTARDWANARLALHALAARVPQSKPYRALLCYARGREAQMAGRPDDAQLEFQRALQLDPELAIARQAIAELQRRR